MISLTQKQLNKLDTINKAIAGFITVQEAATALGLSARQVQRLKKKVKEEGAAALVHKNSLRPAPHAIPGNTIEKIVRLKQSETFASANFSHFREILSEFYDIEISYSSLYTILRNADMKSPKTRRRFKPHRRRKRRKQAGLLLQVDATPFAWFKGNTKRYSIHGGIDDATGQITGLYMCRNECLLGYFRMMRRTIESFGCPVSLYADRHTIFQSPNKDKAVIDPSIAVNDTQFGRALKELSIELIPARSPQAKGRVERLWETLQSRLPVEFAMRDIRTIDAANEFLADYIYIFNSQFAVEPEFCENMFFKPECITNLDYVLCIKEQRIVDSGGVFSYGGRSFKVNETIQSGIIPSKARVKVLIGSEFGVKLEYRNIVFDVNPYVPPKRRPNPKKVLHKPKPVPDSHYYKYGQALTPKLTFTETDSEIVSMLEDIFLQKYS
ncbi:MAG: ISNCY family transposase [Lachnospiraceae bacterium]